MSLKTIVQADIAAAMRLRDKRRLGALRLLTAAIKQREVDERTEMTDADVLAVIDRMLKQRRESLAQYTQAGRADLADQESFEIRLLEAYLPPALDDAALDAAVAEAMARTGATGPQDMSKVMSLLREPLRGRANMAEVSRRVRAALDGYG